MTETSEPSPIVSPTIMALQFQQLTFTAPDPPSSHYFGHKLSIKLQENSYMLWNQQVKGVILAQIVHKVMFNPRIPPKFKTMQDKVGGKVSD